MKKHILLYKVTALLVSVALFCDPSCFGLATLPASQNPIAKSEILATLQRTQVRYAESEEAKELLKINGDRALLLSSGLYLVNEKLVNNDLDLLRAIYHEDIEAMMQVIARDDIETYQGIKKAVLAYFPAEMNDDLSVDLYVNHTVAAAFEWLLLIKNGLIREDEIPEGAALFIGKIERVIRHYNYLFLRSGFWDSDKRGKAINKAIREGACFYQVPGDEGIFEEGRDAGTPDTGPDDTVPGDKTSVPGAAKRSRGDDPLYIPSEAGRQTLVDSALEEIDAWKKGNTGSFESESFTSRFETKLQAKARKVYQKYRLYLLPAGYRLRFLNGVFSREEYFNVFVSVNSIYKRLGIDPGRVESLTPGEYHELGLMLSALEHERSIADNGNIFFAIDLLFDFWDNEKRMLEQLHLVEEINKELAGEGSGDIPVVSAIQDIHGGASRALSLVGFVLGLPEGLYREVDTLEDLKELLNEHGIDVGDMDIRFVGLNDKYDRGNNPVESFNMVRWLREMGKAKPIVGNHDFWRTMGVLGIHFLFEEEDIDYKSEDVKNHHIAYWAREAFHHAGWGDIELERINEGRFNGEVAALNTVLKACGLEEFEPIDLLEIRQKFAGELKTLKSENAAIRARNEANKDNPDWERLQENPLPDIYKEVMSYLQMTREEYNRRIEGINEEHGLDLPLIDFNMVTMENYWRDKDIIDRALWELKNFRLSYTDLLGNLHMHNILPVNRAHGGFSVFYKGVKGLPALELMSRDIRGFFQDMTTIPDSMAFRRRMWEELGEAFQTINEWYSDVGAYAKAVSVVEFVNSGGLQAAGHKILGHVTQTLAQREASFMVFWGHNERKKFLSSETALPYIFPYPELGSGIVNIDFEMSEGYSDRGVILTFFKRDDNGKMTGFRKWGYRDSDGEIIEDLTFDDTDGLSDEQGRMLETLADGRKFMEWYKNKVLTQVVQESEMLAKRARGAGRPDKEDRARTILKKADDLTAVESVTQPPGPEDKKEAADAVEETDKEAGFSDLINSTHDIYDYRSTKVLWFDVMHDLIREGMEFIIEYDQDRISKEQEKIIKTYAGLLDRRYQAGFKARGFSGSKTDRGRPLISAVCKAGDFRGSGSVDVELEKGSIDQYILRLTGMINIAVASSAIPEGLEADELEAGYGSLIGFIKNQCKSILGRIPAEELTVLLRDIHNITLILPEMYRLPGKIEEYNRMALEVLTKA